MRPITMHETVPGGVHTKGLPFPPPPLPAPLTARREAGGITQEIRARTVSLEATSEGQGQHNQDRADAAAPTNPVPSPPASEIHGQAQERDGTTAEAAHSTAMAVPSSLVSKAAAPTVATFLDTPGQEIFYRMRTNGARVADAVVLVISGVVGMEGREGMPRQVARIHLRRRDASAREKQRASGLFRYLPSELLPWPVEAMHRSISVRADTRSSVLRSLPLFVKHPAHRPPPFPPPSGCVRPCTVCVPDTTAAVDGVCLQTSESIGCAEELRLPAVVVLNKIDLLPEEEAAQVFTLLILISPQCGAIGCRETCGCDEKRTSCVGPLPV